ncbi:MAG: NAD(P)-dependent oxidoreductase [Candidatus Thorarchaeota archaeon]
MAFVMGKINVLFIWKPREELENYLRKGLAQLENVKLLFPEEEAEEVYLRGAPHASVVVGWRPTREFLDAAVNLRLFINPGVGIQHHLESFREITKTREVVLVNGHGNTYFTAQHAVALLFALTNKVVPHHNWMVDGLWRRGDSYGKSTPMKYRNVGLLGYGAVNRKVHKFLSGFNVKFHICRNTWMGNNNELPTPAVKYHPDELDSFLKHIDTLIVAIPQTPDTIGLIGQAELELLGTDGLIVNVGRGPVIDEDALFRALSEKTIAGAAIDVWYEYRPDPDEDDRRYPFHHPFHQLDNVVLSPHRGASPMDDLERWNEVIENITRFANGRTDFLNIVDLERGY